MHLQVHATYMSDQREQPTKTLVIEELLKLTWRPKFMPALRRINVNNEP